MRSVVPIVTVEHITFSIKIQVNILVSSVKWGKYGMDWNG